MTDLLAASCALSDLVAGTTRVIVLSPSCLLAQTFEATKEGLILRDQAEKNRKYSQ